jgi:phytoene desaturase
MSSIVVVGAGISGLAAAALMARDGHEVTMLEQSGTVGGRAGRLTDSGFVFDTGPSWYLMPEVFDAFFRRFGTTAAEQLDLVPLDPSYRLYPHHGASAGAQPLDVRADRTHLHALFESREPGSAAALDAHLAEASALYNLASDHALRTDFGREHRGLTGLPRRLRSLVRTLTAAAASRRAGTGIPAGPGAPADTGTPADSGAPADTGAPASAAFLTRLPGLLAGSYQDLVHSRFCDPLLRQILLYPSVFLATDPARAPALYHLMSRMDLMDGVAYPRGGMHRIVAAFASLARREGVRIRTGAEVVALTQDPRGSRTVAEVVARVRAPGTSPAGTAPAGTVRAEALRAGAPPAATSHTRLETFTPDWVVAACDLHHLETRLLPPALRSVSARRWHRRDPGMGALVVMLGIEGRIPGLAHHSLFFTDDWDANFAQVFGGRTAELPEPASVYVCAPSVTDPAVAPPGCENLFVLVPAPANPSLRAGQKQVEEYVDRVIDAVGERVGAPDLASRVRVRHVRAPGDYAGGGAADGDRVSGFHAWSGTALGPAHTLGQSAMFRDSVVSPRARNLLRTGAFTAPGVGLPMCVMSAENAAEALRTLEGESSMVRAHPATQAVEQEADCSAARTACGGPPADTALRGAPQ